jgi:glycosyltransferase involved in cell wall biosynthesis
MINGQKISGLVVISEAVFGCYPYLESIKSFLPVVDELVVAFNVYGRKDGTRESIEALNSPKVRIVPTVFDITKYGWVSYGIARTMGYQACKGDVVLMFDADGVLHEKDTEQLSKEIAIFIDTKRATGYWNKYRIYKPTAYYDQHKHSGIYSKKILGDRLDFFRDDGKGAPNFAKLTLQEQDSFKFSVYLFGYEHVWDTEEVLRFKVNRYGVMIDTLTRKPLKTPEQYFEDYMRALVDKVKIEGKYMPIEKHPKVVQEKLRQVDKSCFGYNFFDYK